MPLRIVLDTNVVVSGLLRRHGSPSARILDAVADNLVQVLLDERILTEYADVLVRPRFGLDSVMVAAFLSQLQLGSEYVSATRLSVELPAPDDLMFLEVALTGAADYLITGNGRHFTSARGTHSIAVVNPREFVELV
jgi:putative PIN family toxin of toxin-antitoxin system